MKFHSLEIALATALLSGCFQPTVKLERNPTEPTSPPKKAVVFSLRSSTVVLTMLGASAKDAASTGGLVASSDACKGYPSGSTQVEVRSWCLDHIAAAVSPARTVDAIYVAKPSLSTTLSPSSLDDPLLLKSLAISYKNPAVTTVSAAGTGATAGFAIGGPWGAVGGALLSVVSMNTSGTIVSGEQSPLICGRPGNSDLPPVDKSVPQLLLPIAVAYPSPTQSEDEKDKCWRPLTEAGSKPNSSPPRWYYRFVADHAEPNGNYPPVIGGPPEGTQPKSIVPVEEIGSSNVALKWFPATACRAVALEVVAASDLLLKPSAGDSEPHKTQLRLTVADPRYIQKIELTKGGVINFGPVCGAYLSPSPASTDAQDVVNELLKQAQAVLKAQADWKKAAKGS